MLVFRDLSPEQLGEEFRFGNYPGAFEISPFAVFTNHSILILDDMVVICRVRLIGLLLTLALL